MFTVNHVLKSFKDESQTKVLEKQIWKIFILYKDPSILYMIKNTAAENWNQQQGTHQATIQNVLQKGHNCSDSGL